MFKKLTEDMVDKLNDLVSRWKVRVNEVNFLLNTYLDLRKAPRIVFSHKECRTYTVAVIEKIGARRPIFYCRHCGKEVPGGEVLCFPLSVENIQDGSFPNALRISA